jgi:hypothetical protein
MLPPHSALFILVNAPFQFFKITFNFPSNFAFVIFMHAEILESWIDSNFQDSSNAWIINKYLMKVLKKCLTEQIVCVFNKYSIYS